VSYSSLPCCFFPWYVRHCLFCLWTLPSAEQAVLAWGLLQPACHNREEHSATWRCFQLVWFPTLSFASGSRWKILNYANVRLFLAFPYLLLFLVSPMPGYWNKTHVSKTVGQMCDVDLFSASSNLCVWTVRIHQILSYILFCFVLRCVSTPTARP